MARIRGTIGIVFTVADRDSLRDALVAYASDDERVVAAALVGSAASGDEDRWSDIDLALSIGDQADLSSVIADWSERMYRDHAAVDQLDVPSGRALYRVFLLESTLQVDLSFWPAQEFRATGPSFRLLFGEATESSGAHPPAVAHLIGTAWLYALHARSSIARGRVWQAEYMISEMRDHVLALACLRHGLPPSQGRGMDRLPPDTLATFEPAIVRSLELDELRRAFTAATEVLLVELRHADPALSRRLATPLSELAGAS